MGKKEKVNVRHQSGIINPICTMKLSGDNNGYGYKEKPFHGGTVSLIGNIASLSIGIIT